MWIDVEGDLINVNQAGFIMLVAKDNKLILRTKVDGENYSIAVGADNEQGRAKLRSIQAAIANAIQRGEPLFKVTL